MTTHLRADALWESAATAAPSLLQAWRALSNARFKSAGCRADSRRYARAKLLLQRVGVGSLQNVPAFALCFGMVFMVLASASLFAQTTTSDQGKEQRVLAAMHELASTYDRSTGLFHGTGWWNSANGITVLVDASRQLETREFDSILANTFDQAQHKSPGFLNEFYDDEGWWALAWADAYELRREPRYLNMAESIFTDMTRGWSDTCGGGIWWKKNERYKNAIANELFFSVAVHLAELTEGEPRAGYLDWAQREQTWFLASGMINADSLVNDGLDENCKNNGRTTWTYNQGVILSALAGMHQLTGDPAALEQANKIAAAAATRLTDRAGVLHDSCEPKCGEDGVQFKGILVRNLVSLEESAPSEQIRNLIESNASSVWEHARTEDNHFSVVWTGPPEDSGTGALISAADALVASLSLPAAPGLNSAPLPRSTPEAEGISSQAIVDFVRAADTSVNTFDSFMIVRHGNVIAEGWWKPNSAGRQHILHSVSKSFTSTAVGLAIQEHKLKLKDRVLSFFPEDAPPNPSANLRAMTVRDLLTMSSGDAVEPKVVGAGPSVRQFLAQPVAYKPGTHFLYNTMGTYVLSSIVTKATGQTALDYLRPRIFEPLGIDNPRWDSSPEGNSLGGYGLYLRTEDIAKLGQLYLQQGKWKGKQLVNRKWVQQATSRQIANEGEDHARIGPDWVEGYGFQFWRCRHNAFRADGADGQFIVVMPDQDVVVAITAHTGNMQGELNAIWDHLLPAFQAAPLPPDTAGQTRLHNAVSALTAHPR